MNLRPQARLVLLLVVAAAVWLARQSGSPAATASIPAPGGTGTAPASPALVHPEIGFRDADHLDQHFQKHGAEFGEVTETEYLHLAQALRDRPAGGPVLESVRSDGVIARFDRSSGGFLAFDRDLTIRTFFRPYDGERYYVRQLTRGRSDR
jgi:hypothetical protein